MIIIKHYQIKVYTDILKFYYVCIFHYILCTILMSMLLLIGLKPDAYKLKKKTGT